MPAWVLSILESLGPTVLKWALAVLEDKYPGLQTVIQDIINIIEGNPADGLSKVQAAVDGLK